MFNKLPELDERQRKVIRRLTKSILNQMMHDPINRIKEMAGGKQGAEALEMFTQIFALEKHLEAGAAAPAPSGEESAASLENEDAAPTEAPIVREAELPLAKVPV
ncbi:hypothetical protein HMSSN036_95430 [Paenibacillus macerans]|nr:hypothetical protein HMSSN036_95430 [Paenibacillus macerans]